MKLFYRGISHSCLSTTVLAEDTGIDAQFLGQPYRVRRAVYQPCQKKLNLVYRGVSYQTNGEHPADIQAPKQGPFVSKLIQHLGI
jgi:hypothetical protein